jgi:putative addiction module killer protein
MNESGTVYVIKYYKNDRGQSPFWEWLESLKDRVARANVKVRIDRLERGSFGDWRPVGGGVHELKIHLGPGYRIYFGFLGRSVVVILAGGSKRTQGHDIEKAKGFWKAIERRE